MTKKHSNSLFHNLIQIYCHLSRRRQLQLGLIAILTVLTGAAEMVSLGAVLPFLGALTNAPDLLQHPQVQPLAHALRIQTPLQLIMWLALLFSITAVVANGLRLLNMRSQLRIAAAIGSDLSGQVYQRTLLQPYAFHARYNTSELISSITEDVGSVSRGLLPSVLYLLSNSFLVVAIAVSLLLINTRVALTASCVLGLTYFFLLRFTKQALSRNSHQLVHQNRLLLKYLQEGLGGIRDVLLDGSQGFFVALYRQADRPYRQASASNAFISSMPRFLVEAVAMGAIALLAVLMAYQTQNLSQIVPVLGALALGANRLLPALQACFSAITALRGYSTSLERVMEALQRPVDPAWLKPVPAALPLQRELSLQEVGFRYSELTPWVLQDLSLVIKANTTVGFVGSTGSGKSTTVDLILGLLQPERGQMLVDGLPVMGDDLRAWQRSIAHVPQTIFLSDATIAENIAFGIPPSQIDWVRVREAARWAQLADFIESRPAGYDEVVGERGIRLSGGQRQRIGIARALYKRASVIVFDEATSALDNATEREVMAAIESLSGELTIILIAHRLSTVRRCDCIFELNQGRVVAQGTYEQLLTASASFRAMALGGVEEMV
jgi:ATP-binding cassette subfamily B protein